VYVNACKGFGMNATIGLAHHLQLCVYGWVCVSNPNSNPNPNYNANTNTNTNTNPNNPRTNPTPSLILRLTH